METEALVEELQHFLIEQGMDAVGSPSYVSDGAPMEVLRSGGWPLYLAKKSDAGAALMKSKKARLVDRAIQLGIHVSPSYTKSALVFKILFAQQDLAW
eukprot:scaffold1630_cov145-Pinguiococcus_pyrenoidosus.AAC.1